MKLFEVKFGASIETRDIQRDGKPMVARSQQAQIEIGGDFPLTFKVSLRDHQEAYDPNITYRLAATSFVVGDYQRLELRYPEFVPADGAKSSIIKDR